MVKTVLSQEDREILNREHQNALTGQRKLVSRGKMMTWVASLLTLYHLFMYGARVRPNNEQSVLVVMGIVVILGALIGFGIEYLRLIRRVKRYEADIKADVAWEGKAKVVKIRRFGKRKRKVDLADGCKLKELAARHKQLKVGSNVGYRVTASRTYDLKLELT